MKKIVEVKNLTKKFVGPKRSGPVVAVDNISFDIKEGEIVGLLGPNGAGKTTTIDILLGLIKPTSGQIKIFNLPFEENREKILSQMNFSAAYVHLPWRLKAWENLYTFGRLYEVVDYPQKADQLLKEFKIAEVRNKLMRDLSSGQMARVGLCKAFINDPRLLLLDEPTVFMDPDIADFTRRFIIQKAKQAKTSILFTSHNMAEVQEVCHRVIFLDHGRVIAEDTPEGLAAKIKSCRVRLLFMVPKEKARKFLTGQGYEFWEDGREVVIESKEEKLGQLLGRLSLAKLKYSQITIEKPTLEDFFLRVARKGEKNE